MSKKKKIFIVEDVKKSSPEILTNFSWGQIFNCDWRTSKMWTAAFSFLVIIPILFKLFSGKSYKLQRKWKIFKVSAITVFDFVFRMKSEDRLQAFSKIHSLYPRFIHVDFFKIKILMVYDPEIAKK